MAERGEPLSDRELDVLRRLAAGDSNKAIADELSISPYTVKTHLRNIFIKLDVSTRTEAMTVALQQGMVSVAPTDEMMAASEQIAELGSSTAERSSLNAQRSSANANGQQPAEAAPGPVGVSHRWRNLSLALLALVALVAAVLAYAQWRGETVVAPPPELFTEVELGDTRWLSSRPLPQPRAGRASAAVGLDVYLIGGETADGITGDTRVFDTRDRTWRRAASKPTEVTAATAADLFGEIYVPGGLLANGQPTAVVEAYSPSQDAWRRVASLPRPMAGALAIADGGFLYVFGGRDEEGLLATAWVYDPGADSWRPIAPLPVPLADAAGGALTGRLYVVGGTGPSGPQDTCAIYNPAADSWETCPSMIQPRSGAGATVLLNKLYVIGGAAAHDPTVENALPVHGEIYDPNSRAWTVLNPPPGVASWSEPGVAHVETRIYALGGRLGQTLSDATLIYAPLVYQTFIPAAPSDGQE